MMGRKKRPKNGDLANFAELIDWRRWYYYLHRAGAAKSIKKKMNKRSRQEAKRRMYTREDT